MIDKNLAIIPARGGSKRIPKKNVKKFFGRPIIEYSIEAALKSKCFDDVIVSTDDEEIAAIARKAGASVPFLRSEQSAQDNAPIGEAALEILQVYNALGIHYDNFCCIMATAPFIQANDIKQAMDLLYKTKDVTSVYTVTKYDYPVQRSFVMKRDWLKMQWPEFKYTRSQDLKPIYHDAGQFYCLKTDNFLKEKHFFANKSRGIILPETRVQDIDTFEDWQMAEVKFKIMKEK